MVSCSVISVLLFVVGWFVQSVLLQSAVESSVADAQLQCSFFSVTSISFQSLFQCLPTPVVEIEVFWLFLWLNIFFCLCDFHSWLDGLYGIDGRQLCGGNTGCVIRRCGLSVVYLFFQRAYLSSHIVDITAKFEEYFIENLSFVFEAMIILCADSCQ